MKSERSQIEVKPWNPDSKVHRDALTLLSLRAAQAITRWAPESQEEKAFVAKWKENPAEEREAALEATLNYFVGGVFSGLVQDPPTIGERRARVKLTWEESQVLRKSRMQRQGGPSA